MGAPRARDAALTLATAGRAATPHAPRRASTAGTPAPSAAPTYSRERWPARVPPSHPAGAGRATDPARGPRRRTGSTAGPAGARPPSPRPAPEADDAAGARLRTSGRWWPALLVAAAVLVGRGLGQRNEGGPRDGRTVHPAGLVADADRRAGRRTRGPSRRRPRAGACPTAPSSSRWPPPSRSPGCAISTTATATPSASSSSGPPQGWGTEAQVQDPVYAAGKFYDGLVEVPGWDTGPAHRGRQSGAAQRLSRRPTRSGRTMAHGADAVCDAGLRAA